MLLWEKCVVHTMLFWLFAIYNINNFSCIKFYSGIRASLIKNRSIPGTAVLKKDALLFRQLILLMLSCKPHALQYPDAGF